MKELSHASEDMVFDWLLSRDLDYLKLSATARSIVRERLYKGYVDLAEVQWLDNFVPDEIPGG